MESEIELPIPFEKVTLHVNDEGQFWIRVETEGEEDISLRLAPVVAINLTEILLKAVDLQLEINKLAPHEQARFPLEIASNVIRGEERFMALDPKAILAHRLNGMFGSTSETKGN